MALFLIRGLPYLGSLRHNAILLKLLIIGALPLRVMLNQPLDPNLQHLRRQLLLPFPRIRPNPNIPFLFNPLNHNAIRMRNNPNTILQATPLRDGIAFRALVGAHFLLLLFEDALETFCDLVFQVAVLLFLEVELFVEFC